MRLSDGRDMDNMMTGMGWMPGTMAVAGVLVLFVLVLGIAALIKYLRRS